MNERNSDLVHPSSARTEDCHLPEDLGIISSALSDVPNFGYVSATSMLHFFIVLAYSLGVLAIPGPRKKQS